MSREKKAHITDGEGGKSKFNYAEEENWQNYGPIFNGEGYRWKRAGKHILGKGEGNPNLGPTN